MRNRTVKKVLPQSLPRRYKMYGSEWRQALNRKLFRVLCLYMYARLWARWYTDSWTIRCNCDAWEWSNLPIHTRTQPPREQSAWSMCWFAEGSRDCNTLMSLHERFSRAWSSRRSQRGFIPSSASVTPIICGGAPSISAARYPHTPGLMGNSTSCCVSSSPKLRRNAHSRLEPYRPEPELSREDTGCNLQHISDRENIDGGCDPASSTHSNSIHLCSLVTRVG